MILEVNAEHPQPRKVDRIVEVLRKGGIIAYPTDSVYAIGCDVLNLKAVDRLERLVSEIKQAPDHAPLSIICKNLSNIAEYSLISDYAYRTMRRLLPGPYTFVLEATKQAPRSMRRRRQTMGIRVPDAAIPLAIVEALGSPLATTSATLADGELIPDPWTIEDTYGHSIDLVIDGGYLFPEPTTVIDFSLDLPRLIRQGKGSVEGIEFFEPLI